ncbi:MAG: LytTR family DNA-binding domain-containing protein [Bacteroidota bacterium]
MEVIIVEDERLTAERLRDLIHKCDNSIKVHDILPSVDRTLTWFKEHSNPDLMFLDIQLSDGTGFDVLKSLINCPPIVFTTAYDEHAIRAFKYNSVDYLLKPIHQEDLNTAIQKFRNLGDQPYYHAPAPPLEQLDKSVNGTYKKRFLIKVGEQFKTVEVNKIAYFHYEEGMTYLTQKGGLKLPLDYSLDQLEEILNPMDYFRVNRKYLVSLPAISQIHTYFNSRLLLKLDPNHEDEVIVSRDRVQDFKRWVDC